jgi:hypothetical protein
VLRSATEELRVRASLLLAVLFRQPAHPELATHAQAVATLLAGEAIAAAPVNVRLSAASVLFNYYNWATKGESADALIALALPWLADRQRRRSTACGSSCTSRSTSRSRASTRRRASAWPRPRRSRASMGSRRCCSRSTTRTSRAASAARDLAGAKVALEKLRSVLNPARRMDVAYFRHQEAAFLLISGRAREAAEVSRQAVDIGREAGMPSMQLPHLMMLGAHALLAAGRRDEALARYDEALAQAAPVDCERSRSTATSRARISRSRAATRTRRFGVLRPLFAACREAKFYGFMRQTPLGVSRLAALALAHGVEAEYVRALVRVRSLPAPSPDLAEWPWPLSIRTFGAFELRRHGEPVVSKGKAQKKPLELMKALVAHGARRVDAAMLTALLWPEAEGDDAKTSFDSTLYRLRKLVDVDGTIVLSEGKLSLDPASVWVDALALEALLDDDTVAATPRARARARRLPRRRAAVAVDRRARATGSRRACCAR